jgi:hypothetical protein
VGPGGLNATFAVEVAEQSPGVLGTAEDGDRFGATLASGDLNGDGYADLAVGAPGESIGRPADAGAATVLYGGPNGVTGTAAKAINQNTSGVPGAAEPSEEFGASLAIGKVNGDRYADLAIPARVSRRRHCRSCTSCSPRSAPPRRGRSGRPRRVCVPVFLYRGTDLPAELKALVAMLGPAADLEHHRDPHTLPAAREAVGIVAFNETAIVVAADLAATLGLPYHSRETARRLTDKTAQRAALRESAVDTLRFARVDSVDAVRAALHEVGLPAVIKPASGYGSRHTYLAQNLDDAAALLTRLLSGSDPPAYVIEECLIGDPHAAGVQWGDYVSVETLFHRGVPHDIAVTGRLPLAAPFRETGFFLPSTLTAAARTEVVDLAQRAAAALGIHDGMVHTEIKLTPDGPLLIEVNGRLGGFVSWLLKRSANVNAVRLCLAAALPDRPDIPETRYRNVAFQLLALPAHGATSLSAVNGVREVTALSGIESATIWGRPGQPVDWSAGYDGCLGLISGAVDDHGQLAELVTLVSDRLDLSFDFTEMVPA